MNIVVLAGGLSSERDVSFKSGDMVSKALRENGHTVVMLDVFMGYGECECDVTDIFSKSLEASVKFEGIKAQAPDIEAVKASRKDQSDSFFGPNVIAICKMADVVFLALHGENGENGKVQAAFDLHGIKYTGNDYLSCAIAMDKDMAKQFMKKDNIPCPFGFALKKSERNATDKKPTFPCVVKPNCGGSSIGVSIVDNQEDYEKALDDAFAWEEEVVVEGFIKGREFSVGVLKDKALPVIEIAPIQGFYDYKNKYAAGSAVETCPADLPEEISSKMRGYAEAVMKSLGLEVYARMDFLLDENENMFCLEANTLPGMTPTSLMPQEAAAVGISYNELCDKIIEISLERYN